MQSKESFVVYIGIKYFFYFVRNQLLMMMKICHQSYDQSNAVYYD